jgi:hypothetical protein
MYSQQELDDAVASGVITAEAANALRSYIEGQRTTAIPDEEQFRLITGFNDIFVSIAERSCCSRLAGLARALANRPG